MCVTILLMKLMKKTLTVFIIFFALSTVCLRFAPLVGAVTYTSSGGGKSGLTGSGEDTELKVVKETTNGTREFNQGNTNLNGTGAQLFDVFAAKIGPCTFSATECTGDPGAKTTMKAFGKAFAYLYTPPATTGMYIADLMNSAGLNIAQPVYAQGVGFASLDPILETWKAFRNVAYLFYVILFLVIGFMVMFRQKISSQAVVTAQQALPNIIISLLAVTFSYAIAGLLIDAMYLIMYLIISLFPGRTFGAGNETLQQIALDKNIFEVGWYLLTSAGSLNNAYESVEKMINAAFQLQGVSQVLGIIGGLVFATVFAIATLFGIFRLFFELLKTYVSIIIAIVLSPIALMLGALPGNNALQSWLKTMIANLAVFPGVLLILSLALMLIGGQFGGTGQGTEGFFNGSYSGGFLPPYMLGQGSGNSISVLLGLGVILIMPDLVTSIKKSLGGSGSIFEQFANNFTSALEKGWKGGELVPGVGISNTSKWLGKQTGGLSGENIVRKAGIGAATAGRMALGGGTAIAGNTARGIEQRVRKYVPGVKRVMPEALMRDEHSVLQGTFGPGVGKFAKWLGKKTGDEQVGKEEEKKK